MKRPILRAIRDKELKRISSFFARYTIEEDEAEAHGESELLRLLPNGARLRGVYKGKVYRAKARRDGTISYSGSKFSSLSLAAQYITKRPMNGWWFWQVERGRGNWVRLTKIRRAGTPIFTR
jgi:hypothetical protein